MPDDYLSRMFGLAGRRAVVTGATSGLGAAIREQGGAASAVLGALDTPAGAAIYLAAG